MSDYNFLMESRLSPEQYGVLTLLSRLASEEGLNLYLVGGAVRDLTFGQQIVRDLDFSVEGSPQKILRALPRPAPKPSRATRTPAAEVPLTLDYLEFDEHLNSGDLQFSNGVRAELGMCREEIFTRPGQRPEVRSVLIFEDLKRRDFAINAMAVSLHPNSRGLLLDPTNGAGDIERHEIRAFQSRCFFDDPSRIYRLLRLGLRLDFKPDERTQRWLDAAMEDGAAYRLDSSQQARELAAILYEDQPDRVLKMLSERKLLAGLDKKLASTRFAYDRFARIRNVVQNAPAANSFLLNFQCLTDKMGSEYKSRLAKKIIRESNAIKLALGMNHDARKLEHVLGGAKAGMPSQVYALLSPQPRPLLFYLLANTKSAKVQNRIKSFLFKFPEVRSRLPRTELQSLGVKPGPEFDRILERVYALQLDGKIKSHPQLMKEMRELAGIKEPPPPPPPSASARKGKEKPLEPPASHPPKKGADIVHAKPSKAAAPEKMFNKPGAKSAATAPEPKPRLTEKPDRKHKSASKSHSDKKGKNKGR